MATPTADATSQALAQTLRGLPDRTVDEDPAIRSGILRVDSPGFTWQGASGVADPDRGIAVLPDDAFQAASITKMVTAATLMILVEKARIELDAKIGDYLPGSVTAGLHEFGGRSYGARITPRQLLSHTSGVADFFDDGDPGPGDFPPFVAKMQEDPDKRWDPLKILAWTKVNLRPHFVPGDGWHYADTGFVLAGLIIEAVSGRALHETMRGDSAHAVSGGGPARPRAVARLHRRPGLRHPEERLGGRRSRRHRK